MRIKKELHLKLDIGYKSVPGADHAYGDRVLADSSRGLFAVADSYGISPNRGSVPSRLATYMLADFFNGDLREVISMVDRTMSKLCEFDDGIGAATMTAAFIKEGVLSVANVGNNPAYLLRDGTMAKLYTPEKPRRDGSLSQHILSGEGIRLHMCQRALKPGDIVVIASDGVLNILNPRDMLLFSSMRMDAAASSLIDLSQAIEKGAGDDKSIILVKAERA